MKSFVTKMAKIKKEDDVNISLPPEVPYAVKFIDPPAIIKTLEFTSGMKVADFGCATGYFTFPLARVVGSSGVVYALDILAEKLETVESQAKLLGLTNIVTSRVNLEKLGGSKLKEESVDWVILVNMLFQNQDKDVILQEAKRVLKSNGSVLAVEWQEMDSTIGPDKKLRIRKSDLLDMAQKNGLAVVKEIPVSNFHYGLILKK
jgi:ubiquinone/menaquinone biosynthesis C-methylase UbiE